jgi:acetoin:2,6-dichlorophenolindophenol oxidoreductase subunit alpha
MTIAAEEQARPATEPLSRFAPDDLDLLLLIRHFEEGLLDLFGQGKLNGTTHTCLGQEYIPVALRTLLAAGDHVFSNHRGHGHYLARFADPEGLLAEIMGRDGAVCRGVGGSQHILRDGYLSTGVQGQSVAVAVGVALHLRRSTEPLLVAVHIGDGTWGEGAVYEALNLAQLWRLPILLVVEHNGIAQSTPTDRQLAGTIAGRVRAFGVRYHRVAGIDIVDIRRDLAPLVDVVRRQRWPLVVEFDTVRVGPHSKGDDTRDAGTIERVRQRDWYRRYATAYPDQFGPADARQRRRVADVIRDVTGRPLSTWES